MPCVETGFTLDETLLSKTEKTAREMNLTRSDIVTQALENYLFDRETQQLTKAWDAAYSGELDEDEKKALDAMWNLHVEAVRMEGRDEW